MSSSTILVNYSYLGPGGNIAGAVVLPVLCIAAVAARYWGRFRSKSGLGTDDWLIGVSLLLYIGMAICVLIGVAHHALGYATPKPPLGSPKDAFLTFSSPEQRLTGRLEYAILWMQVWQLGAAKASVVMFYRRIFTAYKLKTWFRIASLALLVLIALWTVGFFFTLLFSCGLRLDAYWTTVMALITYCGHGAKGQMSMAICDFAIDIFIIALPLPMVWRLHMPRRRKIVVSAAFLLGTLAIAASGLRMAMFIIVDISFVNPKQDGDWTVDLFLFWSIIESGLCVLAACLPSLLFLGQKLGFLTTEALRSFRSVFSLQSINSAGGRQGSGATTGHHTDSVNTSIITNNMSNDVGVKSSVSRDETLVATTALPQGSISMHISLTQQGHVV